VIRVSRRGNVLSDTWLSCFPELDAVDDTAWRKAAARAQVLRLQPHHVLFREGDTCKAYVLVVSGSVRVQKTDANGREILLYRVEQRQSCMLTTTCLIGGQPYPAEGVTETSVELVLLPAEAFHVALAASTGFRHFVMHAIGHRVAELMTLIEAVAFGRLDARIARFLVQRRGHNGCVNITHQKLAAELGTAREVVSRVLKAFERRGWIALSRGQIRIRQPHNLGTLCDFVTDNSKTLY